MTLRLKQCQLVGYVSTLSPENSGECLVKFSVWKIKVEDGQLFKGLKKIKEIMNP